MPSKKTKVETATKAYAKAHTEIDALLELIRQRLSAGSIDCRNANWGDAGSAQHLRNQLAEVATGLELIPGGSEAEARARTESEIARIVKERS